MAASNHDIIVIGASAGGIPPLEQLLQGLPADLPAAVFIVLHRGAEAQDDVLVWTFQRRTGLQCLVPRQHEPIRPGRVYVAPADLHLLLKESQVLVTGGPRENYFRPSIDTTFRSAAVAFGPRAIGVILSGMLHDGTAGMEAIKRCGGLCVVQHPEDAQFPSMPRSVLTNLDVDYSVAIAEMGIVLQDLVHRPADLARERPFDLLLEARIAERYLNNDKNAITTMDIEQTARELDQVGDRSPLSCPDCGGALWRMKQGSVERYRCHLGHAYNAESMLGRNRESLEESLWVALRSLEERKYVLTTMAEEMGERHPEKASAYQERAGELHLHVERIRQVLLSFNDTRLDQRDAASPSAGG
ncbi:MAG TPA: chemotaxis protein CheB [Cytophagales bacterium]|jgi:two-component system chemotaxis response regulator CheB